MRSRLLFPLFCVLLCQGACADFHRGAAPDASPDGRALVNDPEFEDNVHPILLSLCMRCHSLGHQAQDTRYLLTLSAKEDRPTVIDLVDVADPDGSVLLRKGRGEGHEGGIQLPADGLDYPVVRDWIASLAKKR